MLHSFHSGPDGEGDWMREAAHMVDSQIRSRGVADERVLEVMENIPRHCFIPPAQREEAYQDNPLPIGYNQTISQPYIVGVMTELLRIRPGDRLLEIGTGSGYQAAILGEIAAEVHTVEVISALGHGAADRLAAMGHKNVHVHIADGTKGWPDSAPYDGILLAAGPIEVPAPLFDQLEFGGRLIAPVGPIREQILMLYEKQPDGPITSKRIFEVRFVPLIEPPA